MTDKKHPKIRMVSLDKKSPAGNSVSRAADCECEGDTCPECRVQPIECDCDPQCTCVGAPPCDCDQEEKKQQQSKKEKVKPRTFFKIAEKENRDSDHQKLNNVAEDDGLGDVVSELPLQKGG